VYRESSKQDAIESEISLLNTVARYLYDLYDFDIENVKYGTYNPTFSDVLNALGGLSKPEDAYNLPHSESDKFDYEMRIGSEVAMEKNGAICLSSIGMFSEATCT
jgi:hypothetical protein